MSHTSTPDETIDAKDLLIGSLQVENHKLRKALELARPRIICINAGHCSDKCKACRAADAVEQALGEKNE